MWSFNQKQCIDKTWSVEQTVDDNGKAGQVTGELTENISTFVKSVETTQENLYKHAQPTTLRAETLHLKHIKQTDKLRERRGKNDLAYLTSHVPTWFPRLAENPPALVHPLSSDPAVMTMK